MWTLIVDRNRRSHWHRYRLYDNVKERKISAKVAWCSALTFVILNLSKDTKSMGVLTRQACDIG